ncbi:30S ribosomal protein S12 methylthiotransferase RimO [Acidicapsa dinghuensis]|uniref:Ribosomal protein uS12 methylthiotransferase RimO n=1 Tax=Acidicapsa dinghuensis TaxID=2218256 RepID=A0ABW1ECD6_9BACT|nr:30S ribosomal protein S12 methylthiotransferase RimO [Acidicapsa dinghuensis]
MSKESITPTAPSVGFVSLGCPKNLVDSEVMMGLLDRAGARLTPRAEDAEILVVNTCSFIDSAKQESVNAILEMARLKTEGSAKRLIVAGCLVERYRDEIQKNIPEVDAVVGTGELESILEAAGLNRPAPIQNPSPFNILSGSQLVDRASSAVNKHSRPEGDLRESQGRFSREDWQGAIAQLPNYLYTDETPRILSTPRSSAYIKIAEGCDHPCGFCIIPQLRGKFRSRRFESVVAEAENLVRQGVREITLIGQDTTCYGEDLGLKDGLAQLLDTLATRLPDSGDFKWLRFLYAYPNKVTHNLLETIARHDNIASYLDVPLQHASPSVLKRMKRGGSPEIFMRLIEKARSIVPNIVLRSTFIVGFPGETDEEFNELHTFLAEAKLDWVGAFPYSDEEGSAAFSLDQKVPKRTIESRRKRLMKLQQTISAGRQLHWLGKQMDVLVEGPSDETELLWQGRTQMHAPEIDGKVLINDFGPHKDLIPGTFYRCEITESHHYDVVARIVK